jgi:hypothetical protein
LLPVVGALLHFRRLKVMRIQGRTLHPATLAERRIVKSLGYDMLRVRRGINPFVVARQVRKLALGLGGDLPALKSLLKKNNAAVPVALPDSTSEPRGERAA